MHFYPYRVSPMSDATVADELTFASWTDEQKRIARVVLLGELRGELEVDETSERADRAEVRADEAEEELSTLKDDIRRLIDA